MSATVYIALDVEATEMHPERGEIIEIGALKFTDERVVDRWQATVRPRGPVPFGITALTGITEAEVRRARPFAALAPELAAFVRQAPVVGQSVWLDLEMLRAAGLKLANPVYDTFELATLVLPGLPAYSLRHIAGRLGVDLPVEHRALGDAAVTVEVFRRLLDQVRDFDAETLGQVARLLADAKSPLAPLFQTLAREKTRAGFEAPGALGASLRQQLAARARAEGAPLDSLFLLPRQRPERLEPTGSAARIDTGRLRRLFAPGGAFARAFPGYEHRPQQLAMMEAVADVFNGGGRLIVEAGTGTGKALDVDTPIPTPAGWKRMGDLEAGDRVFDERGQPCTVTAAWPVLHGRPCYEVAFSDGSVLVADEDHLWASYTRRDRKRDHVYNRVKSLKRRTYGSATSIAGARDALAVAEPGATVTIQEVVEIIGGTHAHLVRGAASALPRAGMGRYGAHLYDARTLLDSVAARLGRLARDQRDHQSLPYTIATTGEMRRTLHDARGASNHAIRLAGPVDYPRADLPIDPYFLGIWLGDGMSNNSAITTADPEVLRRIETCGYTTRHLAHPYHYAVYDEHGPGKNRWHPSLTRSLRLLGLLRNKHIPDSYLTSSVPQRRALLAGLLDSDGTASHDGAAEFTTTNRRLAEGMRELVCSLGYRAMMREGRARLHGKDYGPSWTIAFTTADDVFRLERKHRAHQERLRNYNPERNGYRYVVDIRPVPSRPVRCIAVDSPSRLYLAGKAFIPTHNSLAYLLPAIIHAVARGETIVVSTATINLQDQLFRKDLPDLERVLGAIGDRAGEAPGDGGADERAAPVPREFTAALLKGRGNYLCLRRWFTARQNPRPAADEARLLAKTTLWLRTTDTGDRAELLLLPEEQAAWNHLAEHESACVASHCIFQRRGQCFLYRARRQAESAHVVVVNHALLLSDLGTDGGVLPPYQHLIVDEAHHLEAEATRQFGFEVDAARVAQHLDGFGKGVNTGRAEGLLTELRARLNAARGRPAREALERADTLVETLPRAVTEARAASGVFFARVAAFVEQHGGEATGYDQRLRLTDALRDTDGWREVGTAWEGLHGPLLTIAEGLTTLLLALEPVGDELEGREDLVMELTLALRANADLRLQAGATVGQPDPGMVYWVAAGGRERVSLNAAPLHVGAKLEQALFDTKRSVVLTSATLATEDSFAFVRERLGFTDARELRVPSPFDYESNVLLYLADDIPEPNSPGYQKRLNEALTGLCAATEGRALVLFTSYSALQATYRAVKAPLERAGVLVLGQRIDGNPRQLLDRFRDNPKAVLLGTSSFWEGVDVVGDALSVLVITKLPFAVPTDPVFAARSEQCADPFHDYAVPGAILRFKQGFGRLIRSAEDRGVCAILDRRVLSKRYGRAFLDSLPPCAEVRGSVDALGPQAADWLARRLPDGR